MNKKLEWFIERIGEKIIARKPFCEPETITVADVDHAKHLCNVAQEFQNYEFKDPGE